MILKIFSRSQDRNTSDERQLTAFGWQTEACDPRSVFLNCWSTDRQHYVGLYIYTIINIAVLQLESVSVSFTFINLHSSLNITITFPCYVGPCHHGMARPRVAGGGNGLQIWKVAVNRVNKQSRVADKEWSSISVVGR
jgi:hypothetical protein